MFWNRCTLFKMLQTHAEWLFLMYIQSYQEFEFKYLVMQWFGTGLLLGVAIQRHLLSQQDISMLCWFPWMSFWIFSEVLGFIWNWFWKQAKYVHCSCRTEGWVDPRTVLGSDKEKLLLGTWSESYIQQPVTLLYEIWDVYCGETLNYYLLVYNTIVVLKVGTTNLEEQLPPGQK